MAEQVATRWCTRAIITFEALDLENPGELKPVLEMVANQASDLAKGFKKIVEWAKELCGRLESSTRSVTAYVEDFKAKFENIKRRAEADFKKHQELHEKAEEELKGRDNTSFWWTAFSWVPVVGQIGSKLADGYLKHAEGVERKYDGQLQESKRKLSVAQSMSEKSKVVGEKIIDLVDMLKSVEKICEYMAGFWQYESDKFRALAGSLYDTAQVAECKAALKASIPQSLEEVKNRKSELEKYHMIMSVINCRFNFETSVKRTEFRTMKLKHLQIDDF